MLPWNYRLVEIEENGVAQVGICEVYYKDKVVPYGRTGFITLSAESLQELGDDIELMKKAFHKPTLTEKDFKLKVGGVSDE